MIPLFKVHLPESAMGPLRDVLLSGYIGQGPKVEEFERALSKKLLAPHLFATNSGTAALHIAYRLASVGPGTSIVSTAETCSATNTPILERGADIVWADIDPWTGNIDPESVEESIRPNTKAVVAVAWGGYPIESDILRKICSERGVVLIEDAAHAFGSEYKGRFVGDRTSDMCAYSFQAIKSLTTIEGGALVCALEDDYRRGKLLRWFGIDRESPKTDLRCEDDIIEHGYKMNMVDPHAVIGLEQLKYVDGLIERQRENAGFYEEALAGLKRVKLLRYERDRKSSYWLFTIRVDDRPAFQDFMAERGIQTSRVHVRNDVHTAFRRFRKSLPGVDEFSKHQISLPCGWWCSDEDRQRVLDSILEWERRPR